MKLQYITELENHLIEKKLGSDHSLFDKMMNYTFELIGEKVSKPSNNYSDLLLMRQFEVQKQVDDVCAMISKGSGIREGVFEIAGCRHQFYDKLNGMQRIQIKEAKSMLTRELNGKKNK